MKLQGGQVRDPQRGAGGLSAGELPEYIEVDVAPSTSASPCTSRSSRVPEGVRILELGARQRPRSGRADRRREAWRADVDEAPRKATKAVGSRRSEGLIAEVMRRSARSAGSPRTPHPMSDAVPTHRRPRQSRGPLLAHAPQRGRRTSSMASPRPRRRLRRRRSSADLTARGVIDGGGRPPAPARRPMNNGSGDAVAAHAALLPPRRRPVARRARRTRSPAGRRPAQAGGGHGGTTVCATSSACSGNAGFVRLRIGVGHPGDSVDRVTGYVLAAGCPAAAIARRSRTTSTRLVEPLIVAGDSARATDRAMTATSAAPRAPRRLADQDMSTWDSTAASSACPTSASRRSSTPSPKAGIDAENFPFCTIEPNTGVVPVPDPRLDALAAS